MTIRPDGFVKGLEVAWRRAHSSRSSVGKAGRVIAGGEQAHARTPDLVQGTTAWVACTTAPDATPRCAGARQAEMEHRDAQTGGRRSPLERRRWPTTSSTSVPAPSSISVPGSGVGVPAREKAYSNLKS